MNISDNLKFLISKQKVLLFTNPIDIYYLTGFKSSNMWIFIIGNVYYAITDDRYFQAAKKSFAKEIEVLNFKNNPFEVIQEILEQKNLKSIAFDPTKTTLTQYENFSKLFSLKINFVKENFSEIKYIKNEIELKKARASAKITDSIFKEFLTFIKPGISELTLKQKLMQLIYSTKAEGPSFDPIIAAGANSSIPHWRGSDYKIKSGDFLKIDFGVFYEGIASDMTRTVLVGKKPTEEQLKVYNIVLKAQKKAIEAIKPGVKCKDIDLIARQIIEKEGYGAYFTHGLGHSLGVEIHENPRFNPKDSTLLEPGMFMTVEPGIYLPNKFGVRIEDDIIVTNNGYEIINKTSKELMIIKKG